MDFNENKLINQTYENDWLSEETYRQSDFHQCHFNNITTQDIVFENCYFYQTVFNQCDLSQAIFQDTTMNKTKYKECRMIQTSFLHAPLKNIDLSTCLIEAIEATPQDVSGAIIDKMQASAFIHLLNIKIKEA